MKHGITSHPAMNLVCVSVSKAEKVNPVGFSEIKCKPLKRKNNSLGETIGQELASTLW